MDQFDCVKQTLSYLDDKASQTNGRLSYPFYTLKQGLELDDHDTYFAASEKARINALMSSLCRNGYVVQLVEECAYCPFSGGWDLYIINDVGESLVFLGGDKKVCDASKKAYGAVIYICQGDHVSFVIAKTSVVPMKSHTLPRLELMAAIVGFRLC